MIPSNRSEGKAMPDDIIEADKVIVNTGADDHAGGGGGGGWRRDRRWRGSAVRSQFSRAQNPNILQWPRKMVWWTDHLVQ